MDAISSSAGASMGMQLYQAALLKKSTDQQGAATLELLKSMAPPAAGHIDVYA